MSARVYIVTVDDRHTGPVPYLYAERSNALARAEEATASAEHHYGIKSNRQTYGPRQVFRSYIEDACTVTVDEAALLDVEE